MLPAESSVHASQGMYADSKTLWDIQRNRRVHAPLLFPLPHSYKANLPQQRIVNETPQPPDKVAEDLHEAVKETAIAKEEHNR